MRFNSEIPSGVSAVTSTKTLVGDDCPEVGTSTILPMDFVRLGVMGADDRSLELLNVLLMSISVAMIIL